MAVSTKETIKHQNIPLLPFPFASKPRKQKGLLVPLVGTALTIMSLFAGFVALLFLALFSTFFSSEPSPSLEGEWEVSSSFPQVATQYLPIYQEAGKKYGVPWQILAAIHKVETDFGRNLSVSSVGAIGHTQVRP